MFIDMNVIIVLPAKITVYLEIQGTQTGRSQLDNWRNNEEKDGRETKIESV